jgi:hypothetical protein
MGTVSRVSVTVTISAEAETPWVTMTALVCADELSCGVTV